MGSSQFSSDSASGGLRGCVAPDLRLVLLCSQAYKDAGTRNGRGGIADWGGRR